MLNTALPWATVLLIGFLPAVSEEGISRMFSISFLDKLGAGRFAAVVVPAFIWGFGHSTYPNQPFYIRGLEVGLAGVLIGFLMLRYGVVPLLVWHFTVDAIYTALLLLRSGNSYYVVSGAIASGILLLPLLVSLALYARRGGFLSGAGLSNGDLGFVPARADVAAVAPAAEIGVRRLAPRALAVMGVVALVLVSSLLIPGDRLEPDAEDATGRAAAEAIARRFLQANGVEPEAWRSVTYPGTGFSEDESVREARPQDEGGIPGFSEEAARYVIEKGGPKAFRRLSERELPLAYWVVRYYQPEKKEEWKVLIDARRARVVAFVHPVAEDAPAASPPAAEAAQKRALEAAEKLGYPSASYAVRDVGTESRPKRVDTTVVLEANPGGIGAPTKASSRMIEGRAMRRFRVKNSARPQAVAATSRPGTDPAVMIDMRASIIADHRHRGEQDGRRDADENVVEAGQKPEMLLVDDRHVPPRRDEIAEAAACSGVNAPPATAASRSLSLYMRAVPPVEAPG